jgi:para-nitrobenzyl esterase
MQQYYANFVRSGDPNSPGLPHWQMANVGDAIQFMRLDVESAMESDRHRERYLLLDEIIGSTLAR